jgi:Pyruvate/2-oxoacid:ferredoxin oxidoreductase delta subunit
LEHRKIIVALDHQVLRLVLYEGSGAAELSAEERYQTVNALLERGYSVTRAGAERSLAPDDGAPVAVLGRFEAGALPDFGGRVQSIDATLDPVALADRVGTLAHEMAAPTPGAWKPWFPVIDYDRCTNCMQCLSFCLFGVYGVDEGKRIQVQTQDNCKTNCPACSRVCPEAAIMFPKYKAGPINGDVVSDADLNREKMKIDISALLGGDVYDMLRTRSERARSRFSKERDSDKALAERQKCLTKLASLAAEIPAEVLMSLPSPEEIAKKAEEAAARVKAAQNGAPA